MSEKKIRSGISTGMGLGKSDAELIPMIAEAGFDAFFTGWSDGSDIRSLAALGKECGLEYQSVHAPFQRMDRIWNEGEEGDAAADELIRCLHACAENGVGIMVAHSIIGMDKHSPNMLGVSRFAKVVYEAEKCGVTVAIENVEGIEYLIKLRDSLGMSPAVGYCWDTGHEMCYNACADVPALFEGKLVCLHLNDNMKQTDPDVITWLDDSHLMPFDGLADWTGIAARLDRENFNGCMMYELTSRSKPGRHTHDIYAGLDAMGFLRLAREKADAVAALRA
ncbi:MAG: sugar phosphate isomerase/epimerase [Clostridia bacterium]|nr:sugar phosphate isomerase/epimerase [Clostridia bacterium]